MSVDELVEELTDFWWSAIRPADWDRRVRILDEIHLQLEADVESRAELRALWSRFVAMVVERLGFPPVESASQARIYAGSADVRHRSAAAVWHLRPPQAGRTPGSFVRGERRRSSRHVVDAPAELWVGGQRAGCRLVDISRGGARITVAGDGPRPGPGSQVGVAVPPAAARAAVVVFSGVDGIGCCWQTAGGMGRVLRDRGPPHSGVCPSDSQTCERFAISFGRYRIDLKRFKTSRHATSGGRAGALPKVVTAEVPGEAGRPTTPMNDRQYRVLIADSREARQIHFGLRHAVFCIETGFEPAECFPDGIERDDYDSQSVHFLVQSESPDGHSRWVGAMRLIFPQRMDLPVRSLCELDPVAEAAAPRASLEVSRLIARDPRGAHCPQVLFLLCRAAQRYAVEHRYDALYFLIRPALARLLQRQGLPIEVCGAPCEHRGTRVPYRIEAQAAAPAIRSWHARISSRFRDSGRPYHLYSRVFDRERQAAGGREWPMCAEVG